MKSMNIIETMLLGAIGYLVFLLTVGFNLLGGIVMGSIYGGILVIAISLWMWRTQMMDFKLEYQNGVN